MPTDTRITIALCTFNGAEHLQEQLTSFEAQSFEAWDLWVSDDGSVDDTLTILRAFKAKHDGARSIRIIKGPQMGAAANFLSLLCHPEFPVNGPVALADQDDVWMEHKLSRALEKLSEAGPVALYGAQSCHTDENLRVIGKSIHAKRPPEFSNALVQNIVSGHSATLSQGALKLVREAGVPAGIPYQDWWLYMLVSAVDGDVIADPTPVVYYRQHGDNVHGANQGMRAQVKRTQQIFGRTYSDWIQANLKALWQVRDLLTPDNKETLARLRNAPKGGRARLKLLRDLGIKRQTRFGTALLYLAAFLGYS